MILGSTQTNLETMLALEKAIKGCQDNELTKEESEQNIADNLITVESSVGIYNESNNDKFKMNKGSSGTGLLLTTDGFILTAYHNIEPYKNDWDKMNNEIPRDGVTKLWFEYIINKYYITDQQGNEFPIDVTMYAFMPDYDIALIKAVNFKKAEPIKFRVLKKELEINDEIKLFGFRDRRQYNQYGRVIKATRDARMSNNNEKPITDTFLTDAYSVPGFSGGAFTSINGELAGIATYSSILNSNKEIGYAGGAKIQNIFQLLQSDFKRINSRTINIRR